MFEIILKVKLQVLLQWNFSGTLRATIRTTSKIALAFIRLLFSDSTQRCLTTQIMTNLYYLCYLP